MQILTDIIRKFSGKPKQHMYYDLSVSEMAELCNRLEDYNYVVREHDYGHALGVCNAAGGARTAVQIKGVGPADKPVDIEGFACYVRYLLGPGPEMIVGGIPRMTAEGKIYRVDMGENDD